MLSEKQSLREREKMITWLIAIVVALAVLVAFIFVIKNQTDGPAKTGLISKMSLDVRYWLFYEGYTTPVISIENLQNTAMQDCSVTVNGKYVSKIEEIASSDDSQGVIILKTNDFVRGDGTIFDSISDPARSACVACKKPFYNSFCGSFSR